MASDEEAVAAAAPVDDHEYPVVLGESLTGSADADDEQQHHSNVFASFGYEFQPASVDKSTLGLVSVDGSSGVQVLMGSSAGAPGGVGFKGKLVEHKETDCLLIFDGSGFRLERCPFSCMQLRHVRAPTTRRRVRIQLEQESGSAAKVAAAGPTDAGSPASSTTGKGPVGKSKASGGKRPIGKPKSSGNKRSVGRPRGSTGVKRPLGRPKGSTKAAMAAKKARLEAASNTICEM
ncbi:uncharacterized protein KRP23_8604 [Phytophthora ramorum]|uniref:uncharacterized protein n=1 Tax=Phytophthora ramorum TaxID=164328 RepID=UPI0030ABEADE|nr:hypothetical protein KRP23_8604 [Phytophthora ramorum]